MHDVLTSALHLFLHQLGFGLYYYQLMLDYLWFHLVIQSLLSLEYYFLRRKIQQQNE